MTEQERNELSFSDMEYLDRCAGFALTGIIAQGPAPKFFPLN